MDDRPSHYGPGDYRASIRKKSKNQRNTCSSLLGVFVASLLIDLMVIPQASLLIKIIFIPIGLYIVAALSMTILIKVGIVDKD